jgi:hypothetical protein
LRAPSPARNAARRRPARVRTVHDAIRYRVGGPRPAITRPFRPAAVVLNFSPRDRIMGNTLAQLQDTGFIDRVFRSIAPSPHLGPRGRDGIRRRA